MLGLDYWIRTPGQQLKLLAPLDMWPDNSRYYYRWEVPEGLDTNARCHRCLQLSTVDHHQANNLSKMPEITDTHDVLSKIVHQEKYRPYSTFNLWQRVPGLQTICGRKILLKSTELVKHQRLLVHPSVGYPSVREIQPRTERITFDTVTVSSETYTLVDTFGYAYIIKWEVGRVGTGPIWTVFTLHNQSTYQNTVCAYYCSDIWISVT